MGQGKPELSDPNEQGRIKFVGTLPLSGLEPGRYEVQAVARQGKALVRETAFFSMATLPDSGSQKTLD